MSAKCADMLTLQRLFTPLIVAGKLDQRLCMHLWDIRIPTQHGYQAWFIISNQQYVLYYVYSRYSRLDRGSFSK